MQFWYGVYGKIMATSYVYMYGDLSFVCANKQYNASYPKASCLGRREASKGLVITVTCYSLANNNLLQKFLNKYNNGYSLAYSV